MRAFKGKQSWHAHAPASDQNLKSVESTNSKWRPPVAGMVDKGETLEEKERL